MSFDCSRQDHHLIGHTCPVLRLAVAGTLLPFVVCRGGGTNGVCVVFSAVVRNLFKGRKVEFQELRRHYGGQAWVQNLPSDLFWLAIQGPRGVG